MLEANQKREGTLAECLLDQSLDALFAVTLGGRVLSWNRAAEYLFGYAASEAVGRALDELVVPIAQRSEARQQLVASVESGSARFEGVRQRKDGQQVHVDVCMRRVDGAADGAFIAVSTKDITEVRRWRDELEASSRRWESFGNMSRELCAPLDVIIGFADLMHEGKVGPVSPRHYEYLSDILTSSKELLQRINHALELAQVEPGRVETHAGSST